MTETSPSPIPFKAETRQLLDILVHSLYTEREIFLRELISNASDALTRLDFELLTNREVVDPQAALAIRITPDEQAKTLTITDTGIGMTAEEMTENLGVIAHSGARAFVEAARTSGKSLIDVIGQFGVGFYSAFMVAEWIRVVSRSYKPDAQAAAWFSTGDDTFTVEPADRAERGSSVIVKLKEDAAEFLQEGRLREIVRKHSDFIPFPIYIGTSEEQVNRQTAIWRQNPREVEKKDYEDFYKSLTMDFEAPLAYAHMIVEAPIQMYATLFVPNRYDRGMFSLRKEDGLKLYSRKVLIQEYCKDLLPEYFRFVQGVVDSEDLPLNVSRESVQANKIMVNLKKLVTTKVIETLKKLAEDDKPAYGKFWHEFGRFLKEGAALEQQEPEALHPLLRFHTTASPEEWISLDEYIGRMKENQPAIYYILGDDPRSIVYSPHLDLVRKYEYEVLLLTDPVDAFMLVRLNKYQDHALVNVANADLKAPEADKDQTPEEPVPAEAHAALTQRFKDQLGDKVESVRMTDRLTDSPARLVDPEGAPNQEWQRVYRALKEDFVAPKKVLELNPRHPILAHLNALPAESSLAPLIIDQVYEDALLIEGLHPDPAGMIARIQKLMEAALEYSPIPIRKKRKISKN
jgi:molecular chaperone HtpG